MRSYDFDLVVIGGGSAGISAVNLAKGLGKKVALVEKRKIGGDCTHFGCVPSKALLKAARVAHQTREICKYGLSGINPLELDARGVMIHVRNIVEKIYQGERPEHFEKMGISVFLGSAEFLDSHHLKVNDQTLSAKKFLVATGSRPLIPPIEGLDEVEYLTNESIFYIDSLPQSLIVLGGGPIGIELASALNRLGVTVTVVEMMERILFREERELVEILDRQLRAEGLNILTNTRAVRFTKEGNQIVLTIQNSGGGTTRLRAESALIAVGRRPNVNGLKLENAGVEYGDNGIRTDKTLRTSASNIYAAGDVVGPFQFSHMAEYQATIATMNAVLPLPIKKKINPVNDVWAIFTDPELARAGMTEEEARKKYGNSIRVYRYAYDRSDRAITDLSEIGMSKFITDARGKLLGIHILGSRASELLHEAQLLRTLGLPFSKIQSMVHIYPSYGDMVKRPAALAYVDRIQNNFFVKLIRKVAAA